MVNYTMEGWENKTIQILSCSEGPFITGSRWYIFHQKCTNSVVLIPENWNEENTELYTNIIPYVDDENMRVMIQYNDGKIHTAIGFITNPNLQALWNGARIMVFGDKNILLNTTHLINQFDHMEDIHTDHLSEGFFARFERNSIEKDVIQNDKIYHIYIDEIFLDTIYPVEREKICEFIQKKYKVIVDDEDGWLGIDQVSLTEMFNKRKWIYRYIEIHE